MLGRGKETKLFIVNNVLLHLRAFHFNMKLFLIDLPPGLLRVSSFPLGLQYRGDFVAGTRDNVYLHYSASCCDTKVDVIATDLKGNTYKRTINVERRTYLRIKINLIPLSILLVEDP